jgi:hypothetical protein
MLCFFRSLIDFDWIEGHLISGRVRLGSGRVSLTSLKSQVGSGLGPGGSGRFLGSCRVMPPLIITRQLVLTETLCNYYGIRIKSFFIYYYTVEQWSFLVASLYTWYEPFGNGTSCTILLAGIRAFIFIPSM